MCDQILQIERTHNKFAKMKFCKEPNQEDFINEEENLKLNQCRKRKSMELFCHKSRDRPIGEPRNAVKQPLKNVN